MLQPFNLLFYIHLSFTGTLSIHGQLSANILPSSVGYGKKERELEAEEAEIQGLRRLQLTLVETTGILWISSRFHG